MSGDHKMNKNMLKITRFLTHVLPFCGHQALHPDNIDLFEVNNRSTGNWCERWSMLTIKTPERR